MDISLWHLQISLISKKIWYFSQTTFLLLCCYNFHSGALLNWFDDVVVSANHQNHFPANKYMLNANNRNTRKRCEKCSALTKKGKKTPAIVLVSLLSTLNILHFTPFLTVSIVDFEQINACWVSAFKKKSINFNKLP